jgi:flagellin
MIINHNMSALFADRNVKINDGALDKSMEKLSSGLRIVRAGDDASGLAVSEKMRSQIRGLRQASTNASNGIYTDEDRMQIQVEVSALVAEVDRIASHAQFNGMNMLTGRFARSVGQNIVTASMWLQIGANMDQRTRVFIGTMTAGALGIRNTGNGQIVSLSTPDGANRTIGMVDNALRSINKQRADLGAYQNRLEYAVKGLDIGAENMQAAESRIRDADMAAEMVDYTKNAILVQSATAMLAQANAKSQTVLQLLK